VGMWDLLRSWDYMSTALMGASGWLSIYFVQNNLYPFAKYSVEMPQLFDIVLISRWRRASSACPCVAGSSPCCSAPASVSPGSS